MICPYCGKESEWCENKRIYGRNYGKSYMCYYCEVCDAYVGCHNNTRRSLGTMANAETRKWRKATHSIFDPLWKKKKYRRGQLYEMISKDLGKQIHVGESDIDQCKKIIEWCKATWRQPCKTKQ